MHTISTAVVHTGGLKCYLAKEISKVAAILHNISQTIMRVLENTSLASNKEIRRPCSLKYLYLLLKCSEM